ncbi:hypothetical protein [uncultured Rikenella sp.]|uniref:hypothetical protein n=1 Tax=uncultured Rikenella sp. TaxID=368003 RepID=UPI00260CDF91|nr:hypothetical protein [uncultured Rikenella sp.]
MTRFILLLITMLSTINVFAGNPKIYEDAKTWYAQEQYEKAIQGFELCKIRYSNVLDEEDLNSWISKCNNGIRLRKAKLTKERKAAARSAVEAAASAAKKQKRIEDELVYVSSDAYIFDTQYADMHRAIKGYLSDTGFEFTDNPELAYWSVYVTALAYELNYVEDEGFYRSAVDVCVKIVNEIDNGKIVYENEIPENIGIDIFSYAQAARKAYQKKINKKIGELIVSKIKK